MTSRIEAQRNELLKRFFWLWLSVLSIVAVPAAAESDIAFISIVVDTERAAPLGDLARGVQHALQQSWPQLSVEVHTKENFTPNSQKTLVIALGDSLLPWLAERNRDYADAIAFYVSAAAFAPYNKNSEKLTAIYRDQPLARQLNLAKLLLPKLRRAAILRDANPLPQNGAELERRSGITLAEAAVAETSDLPKLLAQIMRSSDVLIGIDDPQLYNSETIRSILLTTYRHGKGVIGPSRAFVNAGSLASCYTASDQYLQQLLTMTTAVIQDHKLPRPQYPRQFRVAVNPQVALSLGLAIPDENTLSAWSQNQTGDCDNGC